MNKLLCDVLIFGAGITGASLALYLAQSGINVVIIDNKYLPVIIQKNVKPYIRASAINYTSVKFLKKINVWNKIPPNFCTSYHRLETWEWPLSKMTFHSMSLGLLNMGYIIENNRLQSALWKSCMHLKKITLYCPCILVSMNYNGKFWKCICDNGITIISRLLIGADGIHSQVRKHLGIKTTSWKYHQLCMLLTIKTEKRTTGTIWQIFSPHGPIGFLPLYNNWGSLMWYGSPNKILNLQQLSKSSLEEKIKNKFKKQLGRNITLHNTTISSLIYQRAHNYVAAGGILIGDAAHVIHPLAGQGLNLGLRDVIILSKLLINSRIFDEYSSENISELLINYQNKRQCDIFFMQNSINWLHIIFNNNSFPLKITRNIAFMIIESNSFLKNQILKYALGI